MSINSQNNGSSSNNNNAGKLRRTERSRNYAATDKKFHSQMNDILAKVNHWIAGWTFFRSHACTFFILFWLQQLESYVYTLNTYTNRVPLPLELGLPYHRAVSSSTNPTHHNNVPQLGIKVGNSNNSSTTNTSTNKIVVTQSTMQTKAIWKVFLQVIQIM